MEFIRTLRERQQTRRQADIQEQAEALIRVADFADDLYIAYNGVSLVPIEKDWTSVQILHELNKLRQNYVKSKMKGNEFQQVVAAL